MIWLLLVIMLIVAIIAISRSGKKSKIEIEKLNSEIKKTESSSKQTQPISVSDELIKLKKLLDDGVISQIEFDDQKKKLLKT